MTFNGVTALILRYFT